MRIILQVGVHIQSEKPYKIHFLLPFKQLIIFFTDVNECANRTHNNCDENAQCTDTPGSFICTCNPGYEGNGLNCTSKQIKIDKGGKMRIILQVGFHIQSEKPYKIHFFCLSNN